jgi:hypothetical protein
MKPASLIPVLLLVLLGHWAALAWLRSQMPDSPALTPLADPLFTRLLLPAPGVKLLPPRSKSRVRRSAATTALAVTSAAATPEPAAAPAQQEQQDPSPLAEAAAPGAAQAASTPATAQTADSAPPVAQSKAALDESTPVPETWPPDTRVSFALTGNYRGPLNGSARVQWQHQPGRYQVRIDLRLALVIAVSMISQGEVSEAGLRPHVYEEQFLGSVRRLALNDGWVKFNDASQRPAPPGLQDTASQLVELSQRFASGRTPLKVGTPVQVWLARPQGMALWTYDVVAEELLATPELGPVAALHLVPRPIVNPAGLITAEIWFAPSLRYLPVRIRISLGEGNYIDLMVERVEQSAQPG